MELTLASAVAFATDVPYDGIFEVMMLLLLIIVLLSLLAS